jgi:hypothetical protein
MRSDLLARSHQKVKPSLEISQYISEALLKGHLRLRTGIGYTSGEASWCQSKGRCLGDPVSCPLIRHGTTSNFLKLRIANYRTE